MSELTIANWHGGRRWTRWGKGHPGLIPHCRLMQVTARLRVPPGVVIRSSGPGWLTQRTLRLGRPRTSRPVSRRRISRRAPNRRRTSRRAPRRWTRWGKGHPGLIPHCRLVQVTARLRVPPGVVIRSSGPGWLTQRTLRLRPRTSRPVSRRCTSRRLSRRRRRARSARRRTSRRPQPPSDVVRYGPGVPASVPASQAGPEAERVWRTGRLPEPSRRPPRLRRLFGSALTVILLAASGVVLYLHFHHAPFRVTGVEILKQTTNGCGVLT